MNNGYNNGNNNNGYYNSNGYNNGYNNNGYYNDYNSGGFGGNTMYQQQDMYRQNTGTVTLSDFTRKVYGWMFIGLAITFGIAIAIVTNPDTAIRLMTEHIEMYYILAGIELVLVFALGLFVTKLPPAAALGIFFLYSAVNGLTIAPILLLYEMGTVIAALGVTGGIFGAMSLFGMLTKRDLSGLRPVLFFGLIGLLIYSVIAMLFHMPMSDLLISLGGIALFIGFTAYDTQKIKAYYQGLQGDEVMLKKGAIVSALQLYLDFINLFLYVLRLFASKNN